MGIVILSASVERFSVLLLFLLGSDSLLPMDLKSVLSALGPKLSILAWRSYVVELVAHSAPFPPRALCNSDPPMILGQ